MSRDSTPRQINSPYCLAYGVSICFISLLVFCTQAERDSDTFRSGFVWGAAFGAGLVLAGWGWGSNEDEEQHPALEELSAADLLSPEKRVELLKLKEDIDGKLLAMDIYEATAVVIKEAKS